MKTIPAKNRARQGGWAILLVMSLAATALLLMASVLTWANENAAVTARSSELFTTTYAAEAATEKVLGSIVQDDQNYGAGWVATRNASSAYSSLIPTTSDNPYWGNYQFSGGATANSVIVTCVSTNMTNNAGPPYSGLQYVGADYEIIANAQNTTSQYGIKATVGQEIVLGQIPIFQFAIFYNDTMEVDPGATMNVTGTVHGNTNIFIDPGSTLTFYNDVSATALVNLTENPLDPSSRTTPTPANLVNFNGNHLSDVNPLNLPVGTNTSGSTTNVAASVYGILQVPPAGESANSTIGTNRLYNQADMIITISNGNVITVTSGVFANNAATIISNNQWASFINTNGSFYNMRDGVEVDPVNIDVGALRAWSATNTVLRPVLAAAPSRSSSSADVDSIFVADERFMSNTVITTNYTYTTNTATTTTSNYPATNTYVPPVTTNSIVTSSSNYPATGTYLPPILATNVTSTTTTNLPTANTYIGGITTNTTVTTTTSLPGAGTYQGSITTNTTTTTSTTRPTTNYMGGITTNTTVFPHTYTYDAITGYTYTMISGYTYQLISGYIINGITGYTYAGITGVTTNAIYTTNYVQYAEPGIVLTNGQTLPSNGLSVITPDPAYVVGNWNVSTNGTTIVTQSYNVADTLPSAIYSDSFTVLSPAWNPANSSNNISLRTATPDTVNAAILTGIVPSNGTYYSGGVENYPRLLENWNGVNLYYNGSMVEMFSSQISNYPWPGTGVVYQPPNRYWAFDTNFTNPSKLPPLTPKVIYLNRARWSSLPPGSTVF
jgi:hypothetical protein